MFHSRILVACKRSKLKRAFGYKTLPESIRGFNLVESIERELASFPLPFNEVENMSTLLETFLKGNQWSLTEAHLADKLFLVFLLINYFWSSAGPPEKQSF